VPGYSYGGDASLFNDYVSLTPAAAHRAGWISMTEAQNVSGGWEVQLEFHIGGAESRGPGGGLAFWLTSEMFQMGSTYGHQDSFSGLGVFFDMYESEEKLDDGSQKPSEPFIAAFINDGSPLSMDKGSADQYAKQIGICFAQYASRSQFTYDLGEVYI
jgi:mannose-binding lectin 1